MGSKHTPVILMMVVTLVCAAITLPAAGALLLFLSPSSVFAQQEETSLGEEGDDFASGIVSNVLDGSGNDDEDNNDSNDEEENGDGSATGDGDTNTQIAVPIITQDQREANLAEQLGLNVDIVEEVEEEVTPTPTPTPEEDTTPPTLTVPGEITVEATSPDGAVVRFEVTAQDNVDGTAIRDENNMLIQDDVGGDIRISCDRLSGSTFPIGETVVECTSTDAAGNTSTASFTVTVNPAPDTTPPTLTVPEDRMVEATSTAGAVVTYTVTAEDNVDGTATLEEDGTTVTQDDVGGDITISCIPRSGSVFPIGRTTVECTATDEAGNTGRASFTVTVNPITCLGVPATIYGTEGNDNLVGTEGRDIIVALGGNDRVQALGGDDAVCGGDGDDTLLGGEGNDGVFGEAGSDTLTGDAGDDSMFGEAGDDSMFGGDGNDSADGGPNTDTCDAETEVNCER